MGGFLFVSRLATALPLAYVGLQRPEVAAIAAVLRGGLAQFLLRLACALQNQLLHTCRNGWHFL